MELLIHSNRERAILAGLFLSKFDTSALEILDFSGFQEAFNLLGYALGVKPSSIKNYRDEFDPFFDNPRKGWRIRGIRDYCKILMNRYDHLDFKEFTLLIKGFLINQYDVISQTEIAVENLSISKRLTTGKSAEEFFILNYEKESMFKNHTLTDTRYFGCGYDFRLNNHERYFCVEVKGLSGKNGSISMTEKEYTVANRLQEKYCLFIVYNFSEKPFTKIYMNPLATLPNLHKQERQIIQVSYHCNL